MANWSISAAEEFKCAHKEMECALKEVEAINIDYDYV